MKAILKKDKKIIASDVYNANNIITRTIGLLGKKSLSPEKGILISPCNGIHSIGMRFEFDAVFLDKNGQILYIIEKMKPFNLSKIVRKAKKVLELAGGTVEKFGLKVDDIIEFSK